MLREGRKRIDERLDIFNMMKKLREIDKLKALLLDKEQLILFDNLPKPILEPESSEIFMKRGSASLANLTKGTFVQQSKENLVKYAYRYIRTKQDRTVIDDKLLGIYKELIQT